YRHVGEAVDLSSLPRYGPGATLLWWALFRAVPPDHAAVQWLHCVLGALTVGLWGALTLRGLGSGRAALLVSALLALSPILVRDHASESMAVGAMLSLSAAALLALEVIPRLAPAGNGGELSTSLGSNALALGALVALCLFAAACRPDLAVVALPVLLATS